MESLDWQDRPPISLVIFRQKPLVLKELEFLSKVFQSILASYLYEGAKTLLVLVTFFPRVASYCLFYKEYINGVGRFFQFTI